MEEGEDSVYKDEERRYERLIGRWGLKQRVGFQNGICFHVSGYGIPEMMKIGTRVYSAWL